MKGGGWAVSASKHWGILFLYAKVVKWLLYDESEISFTRYFHQLQRHFSDQDGAIGAVTLSLTVIYIFLMYVR